MSQSEHSQSITKPVENNQKRTFEPLALYTLAIYKFDSH